MKTEKAFPGLIIDKRRLAASQLQKRGVPAYVAEWLLDSFVPGKGDLTPEEAEKIREWAQRYIPTPNDKEVLKDRLLRGEVVKVLTPVQVEVNLERGTRFAKLPLLDMPKVAIDEELTKRYPDLLRHGMWGVVELLASDDRVLIQSFRPMQATINMALFKEARSEFTLEEWITLLLTSMGYNPSFFTQAEQQLLLCRLLPLVQKNLHLIELAPKATGKSYFYENISPRVRLVSGGNVTPATLFVNNATGQWGLLARYSVVVLDEVQTLKFEKPEEIVGGLKGFLANGRLTRGGRYEISSDCSFVLLANIPLDELQRPIVQRSLVEHLPPFMRETAFLDRFHGLLPGWEIRKLSREAFAEDVGLKADFFGDALLGLREDLEIDQYCARRIRLGGERPYVRNERAVREIAAGLMKILFPHGIASDWEIEQYCLKPAIKLRQLVWEELYHLDAEYRQWDREIIACLV